ncbi:hypothetical protein Q7A53_12120 [Halobacillus rhizosphaerae]|uniref:hypothetical protein n=1 Tax=Halobacillus rhizosphaerae TaxID=3064889 RepID=UPI00398B343F
MIYELFSIYKEKMSFNNVYLRYMKKWHVILLLLTILVLFVSLIYLSLWSGNEWLMFFVPLPITLFIPYLNHEMERISKEVHNRETTGNVIKKRREEFAQCLEEKGITKPEQFEFLIELIDKNAQEMKTPFFINRGIIAAILGPIWIQYLTFVFTMSTHSLEEATGLLVLLVVLIMLFLCFVYISRSIVVDDLMNGEYNKMRKMGNVVRDIYLMKLSGQ